MASCGMATILVRRGCASARIPKASESRHELPLPFKLYAYHVQELLLLGHALRAVEAQRRFDVGGGVADLSHPGDAQEVSLSLLSTCHFANFCRFLGRRRRDGGGC